MIRIKRKHRDLGVSGIRERLSTEEDKLLFDTFIDFACKSQEFSKDINKGFNVNISLFNGLQNSAESFAPVLSFAKEYWILGDLFLKWHADFIKR